MSALKAKFSAPLVASNIATTVNAEARGPQLVAQDQAAEGVKNQVIGGQDIHASFTRTLALSKQLDELLSRPIPSCRPR